VASKLPTPPQFQTK
jgi:dolichol phosphate-mannose biosynthesis regulatory protein